MERYRISEGRSFTLAEWDPGETEAFDGGKAEARAELKELNSRLDALQEKLYANGRHRLLVVLQGMDTSGKGGTIRRVFEGVNPSGVKVTAFKKPTETELAHDFLWRVHPHVPADGEMIIFDRSHYEDVLIVRVHELMPAKRWRARYRHIRDFERMLVDEGTTILKFFLHISKDEQRERLQARLDDPQKHWKFRLSDLAERKHWDAYQEAFEDAIRETARPHAPGTWCPPTTSGTATWSSVGPSSPPSTDSTSTTRPHPTTSPTSSSTEKTDVKRTLTAIRSVSFWASPMNL